MTPELLKPEEILFPHEMQKPITTEAHFQRVWQYYREHVLKLSISKAVEENKLTSDEAQSALKFIGIGGSARHMSLTNFVLANQGLRPDLSNDEGYLNTEKAFRAVDLQLNINNLTAEPFESQFWSTFDDQQNLTEIEMREMLPKFIADPSSRSQAEALLDSSEKTYQLNA